MKEQYEMRFFHINPVVLLLWDTSTRTIFLLSEDFLARLNCSTSRLLTETDEGILPADARRELIALLGSHLESPTDYVCIPLTRLAEDTVLREMRKFRGGRFIDGFLGEWMSRLGVGASNV